MIGSKGEALATAYASADVFAFPSYTETFGQVVLEALASGLPVAGLLSDGVCDLVEHEKTGLLLDVRRLEEVEKIATYRAHLARLIQDQQLCQQLSAAALAEAQQHTWHEAMEKLVQGYKEVIEAAQASKVPAAT